MCWNWQTRRTQNPLVVTPCGFDPHHRHTKSPRELRFPGAFRIAVVRGRTGRRAAARNQQSSGLLVSPREIPVRVTLGTFPGSCGYDNVSGGVKTPPYRPKRTAVKTRLPAVAGWFVGAAYMRPGRGARRAGFAGPRPFAPVCRVGGTRSLPKSAKYREVLRAACMRPLQCKPNNRQPVNTCHPYRFAGGMYCTVQ